jgi:hypothetical protein
MNIYINIFQDGGSYGRTSHLQASPSPDTWFFYLRDHVKQVMLRVDIANLDFLKQKNQSYSWETAWCHTNCNTEWTRERWQIELTVNYINNTDNILSFSYILIH